MLVFKRYPFRSTCLFVFHFISHLLPNGFEEHAFGLASARCWFLQWVFLYKVCMSNVLLTTRSKNVCITILGNGVKLLDVLHLSRVL